MWVEVKDGKYKYFERYKDIKSGTLRRVSITLDRKSDKKAADLLAQKIRDRTRSAGDYTLADAAALYLEDHKRNVRKSTFIRNQFSIQYTVELLGGYNKIGKLTAGYIRERFIKSQKSPTTCNEHIGRFKTFIRWAYRNDLIQDTACIDKLERFKDTPHRQKIADKFMNGSEFALMMEQVTDETNKTVMEFLVLSGLRIGEAIALEDSDVTDVIRVNKTYSITAKELTPGKTLTSARDVHVQPELADCIDRLRERMRLRRIATGYRGSLFLIGRNGDRFQYYAFNKWLKENTMRILGRSLTVHSLRHTHASLLMERGMPLDAISRRLGHDGSKITKEIYVHITDGIKEQDAQILDSLPPFCPS